MDLVQLSLVVLIVINMVTIIVMLNAYYTSDSHKKDMFLFTAIVALFTLLLCVYGLTNDITTLKNITEFKELK